MPKTPPKTGQRSRTLGEGRKSRPKRMRVVLTVTIDPFIVKSLDRIAERSGKTRSFVVENLLQDGFKARFGFRLNAATLSMEDAVAELQEALDMYDRHRNAQQLKAQLTMGLTEEKT